MGGSRILARREVLGTRNNDCCSPGHYRVRLQPASPGARVRGPVRAQCWVLVQFQPQARFRSEGPEVSSPVREDGELHILIARKARRAGTNRGAPSVLR